MLILLNFKGTIVVVSTAIMMPFNIEKTLVLNASVRFDKKSEL